MKPLMLPYMIMLSSAFALITSVRFHVRDQRGLRLVQPLPRGVALLSKPIVFAPWPRPHSRPQRAGRARVAIHRELITHQQSLSCFAHKKWPDGDSSTGPTREEETYALGLMPAVSATAAVRSAAARMQSASGVARTRSAAAGAEISASA